MEKLDKISNKIKDLMKLARDSPNDEESQTALLLAQKLLLKYNLNLAEINLDQDTSEIGKIQANTANRMPWWQVKLHAILARNFRCESIIQRNVSKGKTTLIFFGYESDTKVALDTYKATSSYLEYRLDQIRKSKKGVKYKNSYLSGFLSGLNERFKQQVKELNKFELTLQVPIEVKNEFAKQNLKGFKQKTPAILNRQAYFTGYQHAKKSKIALDELLD